MDDLRLLEQKALLAQNANDFASAKEAWRAIVTKQFNWEHGYAHYNLANCCVRLGLLDEAEVAYRDAVSVEPNDPLFSDALLGLLQARKDGVV
jgi:Flp pilus assembly protein TadD